MYIETMNNILETIQEDNLFLADYVSGNCHIQPSKFAKDIKGLKLGLLTALKELVEKEMWETNHVPFASDEAIQKCTCKVCKHNAALNTISQEIQDVIKELEN